MLSWEVVNGAISQQSDERHRLTRKELLVRLGESRDFVRMLASTAGHPPSERDFQQKPVEIGQPISPRPFSLKNDKLLTRIRISVAVRLAMPQRTERRATAA
jgi:hypothetical protein